MGYTPTNVQKQSPAYLLPLSLAALICWLFALHFPLAEVNKLGISNSTSLLEMGNAFRAKQQQLLGIATDLFVLVFPSLVFALLPVAVSPPSTRFRGLALRIVSYSRTWCMPEVFALAVLVAFIKLGSLADSSFGHGFYFLVAAIILLTLIFQKLPLKEAHHWKNRSTARAYLVSATALLIPALILPMMVVQTPGSITHSTLLGGIVDLALHGLWGIAAIVFAASILVPIGKLGALLWLISLKPEKARAPIAQKTYRFIDFIGRWSMLDIFLIGFLASLIDFGTIASIQPGPAAPAFAAAVILTVIAVERFELPKPTAPNLKSPS